MRSVKKSSKKMSKKMSKKVTYGSKHRGSKRRGSKRRGSKRRGSKRQSKIISKRRSPKKSTNKLKGGNPNAFIDAVDNAKTPADLSHAINNNAAAYKSACSEKMSNIDSMYSSASGIVGSIIRAYTTADPTKKTQIKNYLSSGNQTLLPSLGFQHLNNVGNVRTKLGALLN
jgi:hypothetical protein